MFSEEENNYVVVKMKIFTHRNQTDSAIELTNNMG